nr:hypothetical protein [Tanacetum cinerariifolium]
MMKTCLTSWVIEGRAHSTDSAILTRQAQPSLVRTSETKGIALIVEDILVDGALLAETVLETKTAPVALKNHTVIPVPPTGAAPTMEDIGKQGQKGASQQMKKTCPYPGLARISGRPLENLPSCGTGEMLSNAYMLPHVQLYLNRGREGLNQPKDRRGSNKFTPLTRTPKEIFVIESGKFKPPPPMVTSVEKRSSNKFCEFHNDKGHNTDECVQLRKQIEELVRAGKLSHFIKEIRQDRYQQKIGKKGAPVKDKAATIYMIRPRLRVTRQKVTQSFARVKEIMFPPLTANKETEGPLVIEAETGGHAVHRMYVDGGSSIEWRDYMAARTVKALGNYKGHRALYKSMDEFYDSEVTSPYSGIIGRPGIREIQIVPSTAHEMLKFLVNSGIMTIRSTILTPTECATITATPKDSTKNAKARHENFKVAIHPDFLDQEITIRGTVSTKARTELCKLLKENLDILAWHPSDMTGVPRSIVEHRLDIQEGYSPVRQKKGSRPRSAPRQSK